MLFHLATIPAYFPLDPILSVSSNFQCHVGGFLGDYLTKQEPKIKLTEH